MITKRHRLYLKRYSERIGRERRLRRLKAKDHNKYKGISRVNFRRVLEKFKAAHPQIDNRIRAGKPSFGTRIKNLFRKPTI